MGQQVVDKQKKVATNWTWINKWQENKVCEPTRHGLVNQGER